MPDQRELKAKMELATRDAQELFDKVLADLKSLPTAKEGDKPPRLFFPSGIELIYVKVEAGLTEKTKVSVELKVAGAKAGMEEVSSTAVSVERPQR